MVPMEPVFQIGFKVGIYCILKPINIGLRTLFPCNYNSFQMEEVKQYNFLIIGRSGAGKSATTRFLTGDPSITVANSLKEVTTEVKFYEGMKIELGNAGLIEINDKTDEIINPFKRSVRFCVLDVPGLDHLGNRFRVREKLLEILERQKISLHGIIYVSSLTERDTVDCNKLFKFIQQLPWSQQLKKSVLIPILTKYDNLVIDSPQQQIRSIKQQYKKMFCAAGYETAWNKRVYWINHTKSLQFKMKLHEEIKEVYDKQIERLTDMTGKNNGRLLSAEEIRHYIVQEEMFIAKRMIEKIKNQEIPCRREIVEHSVSLKIMIRPKKFYESVTTVSASSIGLIISQLCRKEIPSTLSLIMTGIPIALAFLNLTKSTTKMAGKGSHQNHEKSLDSYNKARLQNICREIKEALLAQWKQFTTKMEFFIEDKMLYCQFKNPGVEGQNSSGFVFLDPLSFLEMRIGETPFEKVWSIEHDEQFDMKLHYPLQLPKFPKSQVKSMPNLEKPKIGDKKNSLYPLLFRIEIPQFEDDYTWQPDITIQCGLKVFDQDILQKNIENGRVEFDMEGDFR